MAQRIKHRRGSVSSVRNITAFSEAEIVIGSGSVDGKIDGPIVYIGKPGGTTAANDYVPISKMYVGIGIPSIVTANFGTTLDGLPYYDSTNKKLYILGASGDGTSGHTQITVTSESIQNFDTVVSASIASAGFGAGIFESIDGTTYRTENNIQITGSLTVSESINAYNINAGTPTSNDWQSNLQGSYFNNFTKDTDVSEILRFVAGLLSSSAPDASPNTKTYGSVSENLSNTTTSTIAGYIPQDNDIADITYLIDKGFAAEGGTIFPSKTVYSNSSYGITYTSVAAGSTSVQSSADAQLYGLGTLTSGNGTEFRVSGSHQWFFADNNSKTETETSSSGEIRSLSSFGTSNGLTIGKIETANPSVIPAAYQDGKFAAVFSRSPLDGTTRTLTSVSSSGFYQISASIGIATGSQTGYTVNEVEREIFYAPITNISSNIGTNSLSISNQSTTALTLTSGSISGAPFVDGGTWNLVATSSGIFEPMYVASTSAGRTVITSPTPSNVNVTRTSGVDTLSTSGGTIQTTNAVYGTDGTLRSTSTVPFRTDNFHTDATYTISGTGTTFTEGGFADTDFTLALRASNRSNLETTLNTQTVSIHSAGTFGQPAASGSMGYFGGGTTSTTLVEYFTTESYRRVISNSSTLTTIWDEENRLTLGDGGDLQVKPGYLVNPESTNGYWYPTGGYNAAHYKWYLREFDTAAANNKGTLTINLDPNTSADLTTFDDTTTAKIVVGVIFGSSAATIFDAVKGNLSYDGALNGQSTGANNPFSDSVDVKGDFSSITNSSGTLTLGINNPAGQTISATYPKIWLLVRYKGTPSNTLERITVSVS
jgi:hypothetical protein